MIQQRAYRGQYFLLLQLKFLLVVKELIIVSIIHFPFTTKNTFKAYNFKSFHNCCKRKEKNKIADGLEPTHGYSLQKKCRTAAAKAAAKSAATTPSDCTTLTIYESATKGNKSSTNNKTKYAVGEYVYYTPLEQSLKNTGWMKVKIVSICESGSFKFQFPSTLKYENVDRTEIMKKKEHLVLELLSFDCNNYK